MDVGAFFLLLVLAIVAVAAILWFTGAAGLLGIQRDKAGSDRELGAGSGEGGERPVHRGGVPEQEEREQTVFVPRDEVRPGGE
jgi:hypothetical protein